MKSNWVTKATVVLLLMEQVTSSGSGVNWPDLASELPWLLNWKWDHTELEAKLY